MPSAVSVVPLSWPVSSLGMNPLGTTRPSTIVPTRMSIVKSIASPRRSITQVRLRSYQESDFSHTRSVARSQRPCGAASSCGRSQRLHSIGVSVSDTKPDTRIATAIVTANSWNSRPISPPSSSTGMNTATSDSVIEMTVKLISRLPFTAASITDSPCSM